MLVFCQAVNFLLAVEALKAVIECCVFASLEFLDKQVCGHIVHFYLFMANLNHIDILKAIVVAIDVVLVRALADVEHAHILTVDVEHSRMTGLPVNVGILSHRTLDNEVAEVQFAEVVTTVAQRERLELRYAGLLVGEELVIGETPVCGVKTLVGIEDHRLEGIRTRLSTLNAGLSELVEDTYRILGDEHLNVDGTAPVTSFFVFFLLIVPEKAKRVGTI